MLIKRRMTDEEISKFLQGIADNEKRKETIKMHAYLAMIFFSIVAAIVSVFYK